jgi:hypothetical protein
MALTIDNKPATMLDFPSCGLKMIYFTCVLSVHYGRGEVNLAEERV